VDKLVDRALEAVPLPLPGTQRSADDQVDKLVDRALEAVPLRGTDLENTILAKGPREASSVENPEASSLEDPAPDSTGLLAFPTAATPACNLCKEDIECGAVDLQVPAELESSAPARLLKDTLTRKRCVEDEMYAPCTDELEDVEEAENSPPEGSSQTERDVPKWKRKAPRQKSPPARQLKDPLRRKGTQCKYGNPEKGVAYEGPTIPPNLVWHQSGVKNLGTHPHQPGGLCNRHAARPGEREHTNGEALGCRTCRVCHNTNGMIKKYGMRI